MTKPTKLREKFYKALECYDQLTADKAYAPNLKPVGRARLDYLVSVMCKMDSKILQLEQWQRIDAIRCDLRDQKTKKLETELTAVRSKIREAEAGDR